MISSGSWVKCRVSSSLRKLRRTVLISTEASISASFPHEHRKMVLYFSNFFSPLLGGLGLRGVYSEGGSFQGSMSSSFRPILKLTFTGTEVMPLHGNMLSSARSFGM